MRFFEYGKYTVSNCLNPVTENDYDTYFYIKLGRIYIKYKYV